MSKGSIIPKFLQLKLTSLGFILLCLLKIKIFFVYYGHYNYNHLTMDEIEKSLYKAVNPKLLLKQPKADCHYDFLKSSETLYGHQIYMNFDLFLPTGIDNGTFKPENCNPLFSVAILVTYRNRPSQLHVFMSYIHNFLRKQNIHYKIFLIEQQDEKPWNKGSLYNIGAKHAMFEKFECLILHDIDLLPLDESNLYACLNRPRHMSASIDKFRYVLIYNWLVGGVLAIKTEQYIKINGFSNRFVGWGGEDDDLSMRLTSNNLEVVRFPRNMSRYVMLHHHPEKRNKQRHRIMAENSEHYSEDGLNSVRYQSVKVTNHRLFTLIGVKL